MDGIFHGFLIIMAAYSLAIYVILKDKSYLYYACYVTAMLVFFLSQQGLLYKILLSIHGVLCVALLVAHYQVVVSLMALNVAVSMMLAVVAIVQLSRGGSRPAQIVLAGWGMLFVFILLFVFARTGIFYNDFLANYGLRIGVSLEILIFSFALWFRINQERQEKERTLQDLEKANGELEQLSSKDALTGLFNRRMFDLRLLEFWRDLRDGGKPLSLLVIDVDHFKQINDSKGHLCGDMVLQELAHVLRSVLHRPTDVITRYGGEEFAVLLPDTPSPGAAHVAETSYFSIVSTPFSVPSNNTSAERAANSPLVTTPTILFRACSSFTGWAICML